MIKSKSRMLTVFALLSLFALFSNIIPAQEDSSADSTETAAVLVIVIGLILLIFGWKFYKAVTSATGLLLGLYIAQFLPDSISPAIKITLVIIIAVAGFLLAIPFQKTLVFFLGGLGGSILASRPVMFLANNESSNQALFVMIATLVGFALFGILSVYFFRSIIIVSTSIIGSFFFLFGLSELLQNNLSSKTIDWIDPAGKGFLFFLLTGFFGILIQHGINKVFPESEDREADKEQGKEIEAPDKNDQDT